MAYLALLLAPNKNIESSEFIPLKAVQKIALIVGLMLVLGSSFLTLMYAVNLVF